MAELRTSAGLTIPNCPRCGYPHDWLACPQVKAVEFNESGTIVQRLEFLTPVDFHRQVARADEVSETVDNYPKLGDKQ
jgi:hypothetical protein